MQTSFSATVTAFWWVSILLLMGLMVFPPVSCQLGEGKFDGEDSDVTDQEILEQPQYYDEVVYEDGYETSGNAGRRYIPVEWNKVEDTYQGCLSKEYILNGTFLYVNLTEAGSKLETINDAETCFQLCHRQDPFSYFISVNLGLQNLQDECGCHLEEDLELDHKIQGDNICDVNATYARIYCGPENVGCINGGNFGSPCLLLAFASLVIALASR